MGSTCLYLCFAICLLGPRETEWELGFVPSLIKAISRVDYCQTCRCQDNHDSVENHELDFFVGQFARESLAQLDRSEDGPDKQEARCAKECFIVTVVSSWAYNNRG